MGKFIFVFIAAIIPFLNYADVTPSIKKHHQVKGTDDILLNPVELMDYKIHTATNAITAASIGALPTTGGTVTGDVTMSGRNSFGTSWIDGIYITRGWDCLFGDNNNQPLPAYLASGAWNTDANHFTRTNEVENMISAHPRLVALTGDMTNEVRTANLDGVRLPTTAFVTNATTQIWTAIGGVEAMLNAALGGNQ